MVDYLSLLKKVLLKPNITYHTGTDEMWKEFENKEGIIFPQDFKHNIFPENKGLLPWGFTDNGDELYWETGNKFEDWKIIVYESRSSDYFEYEMSLCEFLYKLICGEIICNAFPNDIFMGIKKYTVGF